jgi:hypothetical protein
MSDRVRDIEAVIQPALDEYSEAMEKHGHGSVMAPPACLCGWEPRESMQAKSKRRAVGIHIAHEEKRADKRYSEHCDELLAAARRSGWR